MTKVLVAYAPTRLGRDKAGNPNLYTHILSTVEQVETALRAQGYGADRAALRRDTQRFFRSVRRYRPDVIFNLCESVAGDFALEQNAAALFELANLPFTGSPSLAIGLCQKKPLTKLMLRSARIPTPDFFVARIDDPAIRPFPTPAIVKPADADGSLGITARSVVKSQRALRSRVDYVHRVFKQDALVEHYVRGREFQVALTGHRKAQVLAVAELSYRGLPARSPRICSYAAKWMPDSRYYKHTNPVVPARIPDDLRLQLESLAGRVYEILGLRGYARVDFRKGHGRPMVIDVNPNPDISEDAGFARAGLASGLDYASLISRIVELARMGAGKGRARG